MEHQMTISTTSDGVYDAVFIYKLFSNPNLLESLKCIETVEVFTAIDEFYIGELKVYILKLFVRTYF